MKIVRYLLLGLLFLTLAVLLILSIPSVQTYLAGRLTEYVQRETGAHIDVGYIRLTGSGRVELRELMAYDRRKDTVIYVSKLRTDILDFRKLLHGKTLLNVVEMDDVTVKMRTYKGEKTDELDYFINLLDDGKKSNGPSRFLLTSDLIRMNGASFELIDDNVQEQPIVSYRNIHAIVKDFKVKGSDVYGKIRNLSMLNERGIQVQEMQTDFVYTNAYMYFHRLLLNTEESHLEGSIEMHYAKKDLKDFNNKVHIDASVQRAFLSLKDVRKYYNPLGTDDRYALQAKISGTLNDFVLDSLHLTSQSKAEYTGKLHILHAFDKKKAPVVRADYRLLKTDFTHLNKLLPATFDVSLKKYFTGLGSIESTGYVLVKGDSLRTRAVTKTGLGRLNYRMLLGNIERKNKLTYQGDIRMEQLDLGKMLGDTLWGKVRAHLNVKGRGVEFKRINALIKGNVNELQYKGYSYRDMRIDGHIFNRRFLGTLAVDDPNLQLQFKGLADLTGETYLYNFNTHIERADLSKLNITDFLGGMAVKTDVMMNVFGNKFEDLQGEVKLRDTELKIRDKMYPVDSIILASKIRDSIQHLTIHAPDVVHAEVKGHFKYEDLGALAMNAFGSIYTHYTKVPLEPHQFVDYKIKLRKKFFDIIDPDIQLPGSMLITGKINSDKDKFKLFAKAGKLVYDSIAFKKIRLQIDNKNPLFNTQLSVDSIEHDMYSLRNVNLVNKTIQDTLHFRSEFTGGKHDKDSYTLSFYHTIDESGSSVLGFDKSLLQIGDSRWWLNPDEDKHNKIVYEPQYGQWTYDDLKLYSKEKGGLLFQGSENGEEQAYNIDLDRIYLENIIPDIEGFDIKGMLNGGIWIEKRKGQLVPTADIQVLDLTINDELQGDLLGEIRGAGTYKDYDMYVYVEKNDFKTFSTQGLVHILKDEPVLDMNLQFNHYELAFFNRLAEGVMEKIRGDISGTVKLKGPLSHPDFSGTLYTSGVGAYFPYLNVDYSLEDDTPISLNKNSFGFDHAAIEDSYLNTGGTLSGTITHYYFRKWYLDLQIETENLLAINTKEEEESLFYGTGYLAGTAHFTGKTDQVNISIDGKSMPGTEIIIPMTDVKTVESSHLIHYKMSHSDEKDDNAEEQVFQTENRFKGLTLDFNLDLTKDATIEFILDPETGSTLRGNGTGNIQMFIDTKGLFNMYGEYVVDKGYYIFNYGFISKYFDVQRGGTIVFNGDPYAAILDIEAVYKTKANPGVLLSDYQTDRKIDLELHTKISGELFHSTQKFNITAPNAPIDVSSELDFVLNEQNTGNMMIQFLSLLLTDRFIDSNNLLNNTLSNAGSGSINSLSSSLTGAFVAMLNRQEDAVNFGFEYTRGGVSPANIYRQDQVELSAAARFGKNRRIRFNGEMYVPTGNRTNANISGVASIEFPLNKSESLMAKVFQRKNDYQYTDEEQGYTRGAGISWQVNFDKFKELIEPLKKDTEKSRDSIQQPAKNNVNKKTD